ncbi:DUF2125 domain-containing protein [Magnetospira thiophila]
MPKRPPSRGSQLSRKSLTFEPPPRAMREPHPALTYKPSRTLRMATHLALAVLVTLVVAAAYTGYWFLIGGLIRDQAVDWIALQRANGMTASYDQLTLSGFPGRFTVRLDKPVARAANGTWNWSSEQVRLLGAPWAPQTVTLDLDGSHRLSGEAIGPQPLLVSAAQLRATFDLFDGDWPDRLAIQVQDLLAGPPGGPSLATFGRLDLEAERLSPGDESPSFRLRAEGRNLDASGFLDPIEELYLELALMGELPGGPLTPALVDWRDKGGTLSLERVHLTQGNTRMMGQGTIALDQNLDPKGNAMAKVVGFGELLENLKTAGVIRSREATMARIILAAFAKPQKSGPPALSVPITIADRTLSAGPAGLVMIPHVDWASLDGWLAPLQQPLPEPEEEPTGGKK